VYFVVQEAVSVVTPSKLAANVAFEAAIDVDAAVEAPSATVLAASSEDTDGRIADDELIEPIWPKVDGNERVGSPVCILARCDTPGGFTNAETGAEFGNDWLIISNLAELKHSSNSRLNFSSNNF
jgi:hypothetical protein